MFGTYATIIMTFLKIVNTLLEKGQEYKWMNEGEALAVAKAQAQMIRNGKYGKQIMDEVNAMSESAVDDGLHDLEPGHSDNKR